MSNANVPKNLRTAAGVGTGIATIAWFHWLFDCTWERAVVADFGMVFIAMLIGYIFLGILFSYRATNS